MQILISLLGLRDILYRKYLFLGFSSLLLFFISLLPFPPSQLLSLPSYGCGVSASTTCFSMQLINIKPLKIAINLCKEKYALSVELILFKMGNIST